MNFITAWNLTRIMETWYEIQAISLVGTIKILLIRSLKSSDQTRLFENAVWSYLIENERKMPIKWRFFDCIVSFWVKINVFSFWFQAMGCSYFIHKSFNKAEIYNFTGNGLSHTIVLFDVMTELVNRSFLSWHSELNGYLP